MQKYTQNAHNKRLSIDFGGKQSTVDELESSKAAILDRTARETDPDVLHDLEITLTAVCSAIAAVKNAETQLAETKQMVENRRQTLNAEIEAAAAIEADEFQSNILLIASKNIPRAFGIHPDRNGDESARYARIEQAHFQQLSGLSFDAARRQAQEILNAARERREWTEVVSLPKPVDRSAPVAGRESE
jgi:hypothetical protein